MLPGHWSEMPSDLSSSHEGRAERDRHRGTVMRSQQAEATSNILSKAFVMSGTEGHTNDSPTRSQADKKAAATRNAFLISGATRSQVILRRSEPCF